MSDFAEALALVLRMEGGRVNDPRDRGGRTNAGITQHTYDAWRRAAGLSRRSVAAITPTEIEAVYRENYARPLCFDELPRGLAYAVFDAGVNSGPVQAVRWLQQAVSMPATGHLDLATRAAARRCDQAALIEDFCSRRLGVLRRLAAWTSFGRGWSRRVEFVRTHALAMTHSPAATA
jgi:lysozyme family protein